MSGESRPTEAWGAVLGGFFAGGLVVWGGLEITRQDPAEQVRDIQHDNAEVREELEAGGWNTPIGEITDLILVPEGKDEESRTFSFSTSLEGETSVTCRGIYKITDGVASVVGDISCSQEVARP